MLRSGKLDGWFFNQCGFVPLGRRFGGKFPLDASEEIFVVKFIFNGLQVVNFTFIGVDYID
jgi:hypothetical protein